MITDSFRGDIEHIGSLLSKEISFGITRFGDGEMMIMLNQKLNLLHKGEFNFQGQDYLQQDLIKSFQLNVDNYFVGVACPCCVGDEKSTWMKESTHLPDSNLTWANIFVNSNYKYFRENIVPLFSKYSIHFIAQGDPTKLPFAIKQFYPIGPDAWINNADVYDKLRSNIIKDNIEGELFLFCAGPFANILVSKLYNEFPNNTFIDVGSVFNVELGIGANRGYLSGASTLNKICIWN